MNNNKIYFHNLDNEDLLGALDALEGVAKKSEGDTLSVDVKDKMGNKHRLYLTLVDPGRKEQTFLNSEGIKNIHDEDTKVDKERKGIVVPGSGITVSGEGVIGVNKQGMSKAVRAEIAALKDQLSKLNQKIDNKCTTFYIE